MSTLRPNRANRSPDPTMTRQPQSRQRGRATSDADSLDACIAGLVLSNALPPAPPEIPSLYDWIDELCHQTQDILRQIIREILAVNRLIGEFQHVALGRDFSLLVQLYEYCPRLSELAAIRTDVRRWMEQNPDIDPDESVDSSDDEEFLPGRDSEPILDYDSDSDGPEEVRFHIGEGYHAPTITLRTGDVDAYLRDPYQQRRARRAGTARGPGGTQDLEYPVYSYVGYSSRVMQLAIDHATRTIERAGRHSNWGGDREDAGESSLAGSPDTDTGEFESERELEYASNESEEDTARGLVYEDRPASNGESAQSEEEDDEGSSMSTQSEADVDGDSQRPHEWQTFHQYFMYSCRGDLAAVTSQLQGQFDFVPEITQAWVGRQLNNTVYIEEQTQFLDFYLPGETGTLSRAAARWQMARSDFFIQDTVSSALRRVVRDSCSSCPRKLMPSPARSLAVSTNPPRPENHS
jgi:hypothetical protein